MEPLASGPPDVLVRALGPTLQRYLVGDLTATEGATSPAEASGVPA